MSMRYALYILPIILLRTSFSFCQSPKIIQREMYTSSKYVDAKEYFSKGAKYFDEHNYTKAIESYEQAITIDNNFIDAYDNLGLTFRHAGNLDSSEYYYQVSIRKYPKGTVALKNIGGLEVQRKNYGRAKDYYNKALGVDSKDAEAYFGLSRVYSLSNNIPEAIENGLLAEQYYKETNDQNIGDCYILLAMMYSVQHDKPKSQKYLALAQGTGMKIDQRYIDLINK